MKRTLLLGLTVVLLLCMLPATAQFRTSYATQGQQRQSSGGRPAAPIRYGGAMVYPEYRSKFGSIRWIKEQMPLKVYVSHGQSIDGFIDEALGAPIANINNLDHWPDLVAEVISNPEQMEGLPIAQGYTEDLYNAAVQGIQGWKGFEKEGLISYVLTNDPGEADIHVFWVHHFVDKMALGLFAGDIRGYTAKRSFPYKAIMAGGKADFKPVVIMLRTTEATGGTMPFAKMKAAAAHEFGHALGIEGHSTNPVDLMSLYYGRGVVSANDAATLRYLYRTTPDLIP